MKRAGNLPLLPPGEGWDEGMNLMPLARKLRRDSTDAERLVWKYLRGRRLNGYKFRRQVVIEPYIVDFVCLDAKLIVEIDGGQHLERKSDDEKRTRHLEAMGYRILRFWNDEVMVQTEAVLERIQMRLNASPHPNPLPEGEGANKYEKSRQP